MKPLERLIVWASAVVLTVVLTWPIAARMGSVGRLDNGDARYSIWNVAWVARALTSQPTQLYNANIFHPAQGALAYSEPNLLAGAIAAPAWEATRNPLFTSNWVILWSFVLSFVATYALVRRLNGGRFGASFAAMSFAFCSFVFSHLAHVQLLLTFSLPLALLAMHAFVDAPSIGRSVALGGALALSGLASGYYGIFAALATGLGVLWFGVTSSWWRNGRYWLLAAAAFGLSLAILWPMLVPLTRTDFGRSADDARVFAANWQAYLATPRSIYRWVLGLLGNGTWRDVLFPGSLPLGFGVAAVVMALRESPASAAPGRRIVGFYVLLAAFGFWASLGPAAGFYTALQQTVPFFTLLRAAARFGILVTLAMAVLGGLGAAAVASRLRVGRRYALVTAVLAFTVVAAHVGDLHFTKAPPVPEAHRRLAVMPRAPVAEFPYFSLQAEGHRHTEYMLLSTYHWQSLINGYSDYTPERSLRDRPALATFPSVEAWTALRDQEVRYVVMHWNKYSDENRAEVMSNMLNQRHYLRPIVDDGGVGLFEVLAWPAPLESAPMSASGPSTAEAGAPPH